MDTSLSQFIDERVAILTFHHPPVNALNIALLQRLDTLVQEINQNDEIRVVILTSSLPNYFVAGADIKELADITTQSEGEKYAIRGQEIFRRIERAPKPYFAVIEGACLGGGFELALACHLRVASVGAHLGLPEINLGLMPGFGGTQRLARHLSSARALEMMLTGKTITASEARDIGLINHVVKKGVALDTSLNLAKQIQHKGALSVAAILSALRTGEHKSVEEGFQKEAEAFGSLLETEDGREGLQAFLEKRAPRFKDR